jgi:hypothetical protein
MTMRKRLGPLTTLDHAALVLLCENKKFIRRDDGYGTEAATLMSTESAATLKKRDFAVTGWSHEMYPTKRGLELAKNYGDKNYGDGALNSI